MKVTTRRARRRPRRKVDTTAMREQLGSMDQHVELGVVQADGGSHYALTSGDDGPDVMVEVTLVPTGQRVLCRLASLAGGPLRGLWAIPPEGAEVVVLFPGGAVDGQPVLVATLSTNSLPEGVGETTIVIAAPEGGKVLVHDGSGSTKRLATVDDVQEVVGKFNLHTHSANDTVIIPAQEAADPEGTTVLEAK